MLRRCSRNLLMLTNLLAASAVLPACTSGRTSIPNLISDEPPVERVVKTPIVAAQPIAPLPTGTLTAADITRAMADRTFRFDSAGRKGTVTYYKDGTFEYDENGKGAGTGIWQSADGKLCEARNPTNFLPKGTPSTCSKITSDGSRFSVGATQLTPI
jgi:phage baseplate assembly protein gpV